MKKFLLSIFSLALFTLPVVAQSNDWQEYYEELIEMADDEELEDADAIFEQISHKVANPINLNTFTRDDLEEIPIFTDEQIDAIMEFVTRYRPIYTKSVIMMIPYLDDARRGLLGAMSYIGESKSELEFLRKGRDLREATPLDSLKWEESRQQFDSWWKQNKEKGSLVTYLKIPLYNRKGDLTSASTDENSESSIQEKAYKGPKIKNWWRLNYNLSREIKIGFVASQDAGEPFFSGKNKWGYDFYSGFIKYSPRSISVRESNASIRLKTLTIGRFRMRSGLGLSLNNNFSFGKIFSTPGITSNRTTILPHSSRSDANYLQGVAGTISFGKSVNLTAFGSFRKVDATLTDDGTGIKTLLKTGYHRTDSELNRKHNASMSAFGMIAEYNDSHWHVGATAVFDHYSLPLLPLGDGKVTESNIYRMFSPSGSSHWNASIDYGYKLGKRIRIEGETGTGNCSQLATVNTLSWRINKHVNLMGIQRYFPYKFYSVLGRSFSEGGSNQNENGVYIGAGWSPNENFNLTGYLDVAYFAWPKYMAYGSSHCFDNLVQASWKISSNTSINIKYRLKMRERDVKDEDSGKKSLNYKNENRWRIALNNHNGRWTFSTQSIISFCHHTENSLGVMLGESVKYTMKWVKIAVGAEYFNTKDYDSRVFSYEPSTPYNLSIPSFYGHGLHTYALAQIDGDAIRPQLKGLSIIMKTGLTHYFDRNSIGSGYQTIYSNTQTDIDIMLRYTF